MTNNANGVVMNILLLDQEQETRPFKQAIEAKFHSNPRSLLYVFPRNLRFDSEHDPELAHLEQLRLYDLHSQNAFEPLSHRRSKSQSSLANELSQLRPIQQKENISNNISRICRQDKSANKYQLQNHRMQPVHPLNLPKRQNQIKPLSHIGTSRQALKELQSILGHTHGTSALKDLMGKNEKASDLFNRTSRLQLKQSKIEKVGFSQTCKLNFREVRGGTGVRETNKNLFTNMLKQQKIIR